MTRVQFLKPVPPYNPGEVAGFEEAHAARLIAQGVAVAVEDAAAASPAPAARRAKGDG